MSDDTATVFIDGEEFEVEGDRNMLDVCLSEGFDLPYFCWHPELDSVGACRQCAVIEYEDQQAEDDGEGQLVMACMTPADDQTRVSIAADQAAEFRSRVIEWLMLNHPHDCPICDEGGECHLQDMTVMAGHTYRRTRQAKRTYENQDLGPFINHEMNRCIQCYRCTRFYQDYAGGVDLVEMASGDDIYFGRHEEGALDSPFSGNLVEVCPTGVFTDKTLMQHYTRKWDLQTAPSVCTGCSVGCNTTPGERYGTLRRIVNRFNREVNGYFNCDRGRFGYQYVNSAERIRGPLMRGPDGMEPADAESAKGRLEEAFGDERTVFGIGSPRASVESNFALRTFVGDDNFSSGQREERAEVLEAALNAYRSAAPPASVRDIERSDAVLVLGEELGATAPRLALAVRQASKTAPEREVVGGPIADWDARAKQTAVGGDVGPVFNLTVDSAWLDHVADAHRATPGEVARLGAAIAVKLESGDAPQSLDESERELVERIAEALSSAERPVVVSGCGCGSRELVEAAGAVAAALHDTSDEARLAMALPEANSAGVGMLGGASLEQLVERVEDASPSTLVVLENDLSRRLPGADVDALVDAVDTLVVLDHIETATSERADLVFSSATFAEGAGTFVNFSGRAQRFFRVHEPDGPIQEGWRWLRDLDRRLELGRGLDWETLDDVLEAIGSTESQLEGIRDAAPSADFRQNKQKIPRKPRTYSGRTSNHAHESVHEPQPPVEDTDSPLSHSMEGSGEEPPASLSSFTWAPGWNSEQALNKFQDEVAGPTRGGPSGTRLIAFDERSADGAPHVPTRQLSTRELSSDDEWLLVPTYHVFGSEELSARGAAIQQRAPEPYVGLGERRAVEIGLEEGQIVRLHVGDSVLELPVRLRPELPRNVAVLPVGLRGMEETAALSLPEVAEIEAVGEGDG